MSPLVPPHEKPKDYYSHDRADLVEILPKPLGRVLDVGCGEGRVGVVLRAHGAEWVSGIELFEAAAEEARRHYDEVFTGDAVEGLSQVTGPFDTVVAYDVIEHLVDPRALLEQLHAVASPGARLHVSIPNARYFEGSWQLIVRGTFGYTDEGLRDATHLRWFTRRDIEELLQGTGWKVIHTRAAYGPRVARFLKVMRGVGTEFLTVQWSVLTVRGDRSAA